MTIPKEAIEKAIAGGWKYNSAAIESIDFSDGSLDYGFITTTRGTYAVNPEQIALDPLFWQALGKTLGWPEEDAINVGPIISVIPWQYAAHNFYDLVLTNGDTDAYWKEILTSK